MTLPAKHTRDEWPTKAYNNPDFLNSDPARSIRVLCEMTEPGLRFSEEKVEDTIVLFGSARMKPIQVAEKQLATVQARIQDPDNMTLEETRSLHAAKCAVQSSAYYETAVQLSESLTQWSMNLPGPHQDRFLICSGGGPGIMEAANRGANNVGGKSVGLGISLPFEQGLNEYIPQNLKFEFHYFFVRKYWFVLLAKALVAFPGGFGTMDELFETLTLVQTKKVDILPPIVLFGSEFWNEVVNFEALAKWGVISPEDLSLFKIVDSVEAAHDYIVRCLTERFLQ